MAHFRCAPKADLRLGRRQATYVSDATMCIPQAREFSSTPGVSGMNGRLTENGLRASETNLSDYIRSHSNTKPCNSQRLNPVLMLLHEIAHTAARPGTCSPRRFRSTQRPRLCALADVFLDLGAVDAVRLARQQHHPAQLMQRGFVCGQDLRATLKPSVRQKCLIATPPAAGSPVTALPSGIGVTGRTFNHPLG